MGVVGVTAAEHEHKDTRADRRDRYHKVLRAVRANTGDPQPPAALRSSIATTLTHYAPMDAAAFSKAIRAAIANGDLLRWTGPEGRTRLALADAEHLDEDDVAALREMAATEADRVPPDQSIIAWVNRHIQRIREVESDE